MQESGPLSSPLLEHVERSKEVRRRLHGSLCRLGVSIRLLTLLNGLALFGAAGFSFYLFGMDEIINENMAIEHRARTAVQYVLMAGSGLFLLGLERASTASEAGARSSIGLAFGGSGRLLLLLTLALISAPAVHYGRSEMEWYATGGAVAFLVTSALLQAWMLGCNPDYRNHVVADLEMPKIQVDSTAFPQVYQRDEDTHLHMGVLLPGFASRDTCTMSANCSTVTLVGDVSHLEAPYSPVDSSNSTSGPFGPFQRQVQLAHPVDITVPTESRMGLGSK